VHRRAPDGDAVVDKREEQAAVDEQLVVAGGSWCASDAESGGLLSYFFLSLHLHLSEFLSL
jgi:hypothetical protein